MPRGPGRDGRPWRRAKERIRRTQNICHLCGTPIDPTLTWPDPMSFSVDHVEPYSLRPELARDPNNLAAAHLSCNSRKGNGTRGDQTPTSRDW